MSKKKKKITLKLSFFASPAVGKTAIEIVHNFTQNFFCRARWDWDNLTNGIFPGHKLQGVFTDVGEWIHVLLNITHRSMFAQGLEYRYWRQSVQFTMTERVRNKSACTLKTNKQTKQTKNNSNNNINGTGLANKLKFNVCHGNFFFKNSQWSYRKYYSLPSTIDERSIALFSR